MDQTLRERNSAPAAAPPENFLANERFATHVSAGSIMPTYEYTCPHCGTNFELFQSMRDAPIKECPHCHKVGVKRLVGGGAGLIFKGSGFYITDYRKKSGGGEGGESKAAPSGDAKPSSTPPAAAPAPAATTPSAPSVSSDKK